MKIMRANSAPLISGIKVPVKLRCYSCKEELFVEILGTVEGKKNAVAPSIKTAPSEG
jgi:hypothetical protein